MKQKRIVAAEVVILLFLLVVSAGLLASETQPEVEPDLHHRPIIEENGRRLLWAGEDEEGNVEWFDMTGSTVDPHRFQFGIGKDRIESIDQPEFVAADDPRLQARGISLETPVLGVFLNEIARAYPVKLMDEHEVVNDDFAGEAFAVLW